MSSAATKRARVLATYGALAFAAVFATHGGSASAWTSVSPGLNPAWPGPAPYAINQNGSVDLGGFAATEAEVRRAIEDWTRVSCSGLEVSYRGSTSAVPGPGASAVIGWIESGWVDEPNAIGVTSPAWNGSGDLVNAWMAMNGVNFTWTTGAGSGSRVNTYSIALHEGGHYMGLGHSADPNAAMYFAYSGGISALEADDETGICTLYPGGGGGVTDCTTTGCPTGQVCESGTCVDAGGGGTGGVCDSCTSDAACGGGGLCLRYPDGRGYCGASCGSDADCGGSNESCEMVSDGSFQCVRRDASGAGTCAIGPGDPVGGGGTPPDPGTTPPDPSAECTTSRDCPSGTRCDASGTCIAVATGAVGDACTTSDDCVSGLCAVDSVRDETYCTALCDETSPCPGGFSCVSAGSGMRACQPEAPSASTGTPGAALSSGTIVGGCSVVAPGDGGARGGVAWLGVLGLAVIAAEAVRRRRRRRQPEARTRRSQLSR